MLSCGHWIGAHLHHAVKGHLLDAVCSLPDRKHGGLQFPTQGNVFILLMLFLLPPGWTAFPAATCKEFHDNVENSEEADQ